MNEKQTIALTGNITPEDVSGLPTSATLDFQDVTALSFAALRELLRLQEVEHGLDIVNVPEDIFMMLDGTGARRFIPVTPKPREIDPSSYHMRGDSNQGDCYFDEDGDSMVKVYKSDVLLASARKEQRGAYAAFACGLPTPLMGGEVTFDGRPGILFESARNKKSYTRLIADDPDGIEGYVKTFSDMALELHRTPCDTTLVTRTVDVLRAQVAKTEFLGKERQAKLLRFMDDVEPMTVCNHGDLHPGNLIRCDAGTQWIDLGEFGYGNPLFDLGSTYFACVTMGEISPDAIMSNFHFPFETMCQVWRLFLKYYFGAETPSQQDEVEHMLLPFATMRLVSLCNMTAHMPGGGIYPNCTDLVEGKYFSKI